ncbi:MAG: hypothetical protein PVG39_02075 [Desulfobacteraceae bacterium]
MENHEKHCTNNPNRECRMCYLNGYSKPPKTMEELFEIIDNHIKTVQIKMGGATVCCPKWDSKEIIKSLDEAVDGCPACILAALRQYKRSDIWVEYDFEAKKKEFWEIVNESY